MAGRHVHDMVRENRQADTWHCTSCAFRCAGEALAKVKANPQVHRAIKKRKGYVTPLYKG